MNKRLSSEEFEVYSKAFNFSDRRIKICHLILVKGEKQADVAKQFGISKGAVSQHKKAFLDAVEASLIPNGYKRVTAVLPNHHAYQVEVWAKKAEEQIRNKNESFVCNTAKRRSREN